MILHVFRSIWKRSLTWLCEDCFVKSRRALLVLTVALSLSGCAVRHESVRTTSTQALWKSTSKSDAFLDLRCQGLDPDEVWQILRPYHELEEKLWAFREPMPGDNDEIIPLHLGCRHYRGGMERYEWNPSELDRRLGKR